MTPAFGAVAGYSIGVWSAIILEGIYILAAEGRAVESEDAKKVVKEAASEKKKSGSVKVIDKRPE